MNYQNTKPTGIYGGYLWIQNQLYYKIQQTLIQFKFNVANGFLYFWQFSAALVWRTVFWACYFIYPIPCNMETM